MDKAGTEKIAEMLANGEENKAIIAYMKMLGYDVVQIKDAISRAVPASTPAAEAEPLIVSRIETKDKRRTPKAIVALLLVVITVGITVYMYGPDLVSVSSIDSDEGAPIMVTSLLCTGLSVQLKVANARLAAVPASELMVAENLAACTPVIEFDGTFDERTVTCTGSFTEGKNYTLIGNATRSVKFTCSNQ